MIFEPAGALDEGARDEYVAGVHAAGNPYFDYLFGSSKTARDVLRAWTDRSTSEVSPTRARLAHDGGRIAAGYIVLDAPTLRACRSADLMGLLTTPGVRAADLQPRMRATRGLFTDPEPDEWYLSKVWVHPDFRGAGFGALALAAMERQVFAQGGTAVRLDVWSDNHPARRLYDAHGYTPVGTSVSAAGLSYVSMRRVFAA